MCSSKYITWWPLLGINTWFLKKLAQIAKDKASEWKGLSTTKKVHRMRRAIDRRFDGTPSAAHVIIICMMMSMGTEEEAEVIVQWCKRLREDVLVDVWTFIHDA